MTRGPFFTRTSPFSSKSLGMLLLEIAVDDIPLCGNTSTMRRKLRLESWGMVTHIGERYCKECERLAIERNIL